jgi:uncharacterized UPF0146 family protein
VVDATGEPSIRSEREAMPAVEVALAMRVTVLVTVAPLLGDVIEVEMPVALITNDMGSDCGEPLAPGAEIVAVAL